MSIQSWNGRGKIAGQAAEIVASVLVTLVPRELELEPRERFCKRYRQVCFKNVSLSFR